MAGKAGRGHGAIQIPHISFATQASHFMNLPKHHQSVNRTPVSYDNDSEIISEFVDGKLKVTETKQGGLLRSKEIQGVRTEKYGYDSFGRLTSIANTPGSNYEYLRNELGSVYKVLSNNKPIWEILINPQSHAKTRLNYDRKGYLRSAIELETKHILSSEELTSLASIQQIKLRHAQ